MYVYLKNDSTVYAGLQPVAKLMRDNLESLLMVRNTSFNWVNPSNQETLNFVVD